MFHRAVNLIVREESAHIFRMELTAISFTMSARWQFKKNQSQLLSIEADFGGFRRNLIG